MLKIRNLNTYYGAIHALKGIDLDVPEGKIVTLVGSNEKAPRSFPPQES